MGSDEVGKGWKQKKRDIVFIELGEYLRIKCTSVRRKKQRQLGKSGEKLKFKLQKIFDERS